MFFFVCQYNDLAKVQELGEKAEVKCSDSASYVDRTLSGGNGQSRPSSYSPDAHVPYKTKTSSFRNLFFGCEPMLVWSQP